MALASRDVKLRYRQTALGVAWVVLQPLIAAAIFAFVFGHVAKLKSAGAPYFAFAFAGMLAWTAFNNTLTKVSGSLVQNSHLVSKIFFPRLVLPISMLLSSVIDFAVSLVVMVILMVIYGIAPHLQILLTPVWFLLILLLSLGVGLIASALMVPYRDVQYIIPVATQFLLYASPVAYALASVPARWQSLYGLNPLVGLLEGFRWSLLGTAAPAWREVLYAAAFSLVMFVLGAYYFKHMERRFADVI
ncbi:transport permease protein [Capsulimonas corticalis]|uniref:Transport permease protein n=2 Tax=Capsulimonas corticalis TaxID=2219043 RepID=A0A402CU93_9BACT|nr:transport permease protein [Capsulimonas corticalis]